MMLTDLAGACRKAGLRVEEVSGWRSRGHDDFASVETIVCHHTAGPASGVMPSLGIVTNGRAGLSGPLCNLALGRDGTVYVVAAGVAWHAGVVSETRSDNWHAIGIEAEATGTGSWPKVQMDAYARLCAALCAQYDVPVNRVLGHKEVCSPAGRKIDPNFDMTKFRAAVAGTTQEDDMPLSDDDVTKIVNGIMRRPLNKAGTLDVAGALRQGAQADDLRHALSILPSAVAKAVEASLPAGDGTITRAQVRTAAAAGAERAVREVLGGLDNQE